jgi:YidC/Oxa1 family membrane protein insertase
MSAIFNAVFYKPLYNGLVFLFDLLPWFDAGIILILFTVIIKLILFPLSKKSLTAQAQMKKIEPELKGIKEKYKNNQQEAAKATMELYRKNKVNPFASILIIIIQIPIVFALYFIFLRAGLPNIKSELLYSFISAPGAVNIMFLGLIDLSVKSALLAVLAGISSFFQIRYSLSGQKPKPPSDKPSFKDDLARSMSMQMKYVFPIVVVFIAYNISGAVALYWITSNVFTLGQELVIRRRLKKDD